MLTMVKFLSRSTSSFITKYVNFAYGKDVLLQQQKYFLLQVMYTQTISILTTRRKVKLLHATAGGGYGDVVMIVKVLSELNIETWTSGMLIQRIYACELVLWVQNFIWNKDLKALIIAKIIP